MRRCQSDSGPRPASSIEQDHAANGFAALQCVETPVYFAQRQAAANQLVEHPSALEIGPRELRKIAPRARIAVTDAADAFLLHQRAPAERHILVDVDLAEPDHLAAGPHRLGSDRKRISA